MLIHAEWHEDAQPLVTCIIPNFNMARFVGDAVRACLAQTYPSIEIIVVDDGSQDNSLDILRAFGDRITIVCQPNSGVSVARNVGVFYSKGEYIAFCDADDEWIPDKIFRQVEALQKRQDASGCHTDFELTGQEYQRFERDAVRIRAASRITPGTASLYEENRIIMSTMMVRRSAFVRAGGFRAGVFYPADWLLWTAIEEIGPIVYVDHPLAKYRIHEGCSTAQGSILHDIESMAAMYFLRLLMVAKILRGVDIRATQLNRGFGSNVSSYIRKLDSTKPMQRDVGRLLVQMAGGFRLKYYIHCFPLVLRRLWTKRDK